MSTFARAYQADENSPPAGRVVSGEQAGLMLEQVPQKVDYVYHDSFASPSIEKDLFEDEADASHALARPAGLAGTAVQGRQRAKTEDVNARLFLKYNCARYMVSKLMADHGRGGSTETARKIICWHKKAMKARSDLVEANLGLVLAMAKRTHISNVEFCELVSQGSMALLRSIDNFDFSKGFKFSTYACRAILRSLGRLAAETAHYRKRYLTESTLDFRLRLKRPGDDEKEWQESVSTLREVLARNSAELSKLEQTIISERFALGRQGQGSTFAQIGRVVGLTNERVRQIHNAALAKIRAALEEALLGKTRAARRRPA